MVACKATAIQALGMTLIICVGETLRSGEAGQTEAKVLHQVTSALAGRTAQQIGSLVIAYEPIWAIGTGRTTAADAQAVIGTIRGTAPGSAAPTRRPRSASSTGVRQGGQHRRAHGRAGHRRGPRRRSQPGPRGVRPIVQFPKHARP